MPFNVFPSSLSRKPLHRAHRFAENTQGPGDRIGFRLGVLAICLAFICGASSPSRAASSLTWAEGPGFRHAAVAPFGDKPDGFSQVMPAQTGIQFSNVVEFSRGLTNSVLFNGSGVAAGDVDQDGWADLFLCGLGGRSTLYRNHGDWRFEDITSSSGLNLRSLDVTGALLMDLEGDGDLDLVLNTFGQGTHLYLNDGASHFQEMRLSVGLNSDQGGMSLAAGDLDGDGFLDLYVVNYRTSALVDMPQTKFWLRKVDGKQVISTVNGRPVTEPDLANRYRLDANGGVSEQGELDAVYHNAGGTNFVSVSFTAGNFLDESGSPLKELPFDWGLSAMIRDLNQDGLPDIYVCNDFDSPDRIWLNQGKGVFRAAPQLAFRKTSLFSMGVDVADINRDGLDDVFVVDMLSREHPRRMNFTPDRRAPIPSVGAWPERLQYPKNTLFLNRGDGTYAEIGSAARVEASEWSWCPVFLDVDLDGWEDILVTNGHERDARNMDVADQLKALRAGRTVSNEEILSARKLFPRLATPNIAFRNNRDLTFQEKAHDWGFDDAGVSHGIALVDLDNDGDQDVVLNNLNAPVTLYRNNASAHRLAVRLKGKAPNTQGIGARIEVRGGPVRQSQEMICGGRYLSSDAPSKTFATGGSTNPLEITVYWRGGKRSVVAQAVADHLYEINEDGATSESKAAPMAEKPMFEDVSALIQHQHRETVSEDYARQPLLPRKLSQLGPGMTWYDLDQDGWDDLLIPGGKGGSLAIYRNNQHGGFSPVPVPGAPSIALREQTSVVASDSMLYLGMANEEGPGIKASVGAVIPANPAVAPSALPESNSSTGPMAIADVDGDGRLDLFVGGRYLPGQYPKPASSQLLLRGPEGLKLSETLSKPFEGVGLVSDAMFSDLDADGQPDLVLACEWGPIRVFHNERGRFTEMTQALGLAGFKGLWNGVTAGDFDGDGRLDLAASNFGRNTPYESHRGHPIRLWHGDYRGEGVEDVIESWYEEPMGKWVPIRILEVLSRRLPYLREKYPTRLAYAAQSVEEILGDNFKRSEMVEAQWFESTIFLNRGDHFEVRALPAEAQMSASFGIAASDLDGDGLEDLFLCQNFFQWHPGIPRDDAGRGLWLKGDGHGGFHAVSGTRSGIVVYGEQRGCAIADFDRDGRVDIALAQNGAETRLFRNLGAKPGVRVQVTGPRGNPNAVGTQIRLLSGTTSGPVREIRAGGGYWSQSSSIQIMSLTTPPSEVWVRWPGGKVTTRKILEGAKEVNLTAD